MGDSCSMKGFLEFSVLVMINKRNFSGQEIRCEIEKRRGCKPSPGTIYPVLKELQKKGLIEEVKNGKKEKKYSITKKGKSEVERNKKIFLAMFKELFKNKKI